MTFARFILLIWFAIAWSFILLGVTLTIAKWWS